MLPPFLDLLLQRPLGPPRVGQAARGAGGADDLADGAPDRRQAERDFDRTAILAQAHRFEVLDRFTRRDPPQIVLALLASVGWHDDRGATVPTASSAE